MGRTASFKMMTTKKDTHSIRVVERVMGIEPTRPAWKAGILPLNYTRTKITLPFISYRKKTFFRQRSLLDARIFYHIIVDLSRLFLNFFIFFVFFCIYG